MTQYYHLAATVNDEIKDVLVEKETFEDPDEANNDITWFFVPSATGHKNYGLVDIVGGDFLPDTIGV